jgi:hypothetical protein
MTKAGESLRAPGWHIVVTRPLAPAGPGRAGPVRMAGGSREEAEQGSREVVGILLGDVVAGLDRLAA